MGVTPLTFFSTNCFETFQMFCFAWNEDVHWFGYDTLNIFSHFFCFVNLVSSFLHEMLSKCIDSGYLVGAIPLTVLHKLF